MNSILVRGAAASLVIIAVALAFLAVGTFGLRTADADPHAGQSVDVVIIGGEDLDIAAHVVNGGYLPTSGPAGGLGDFNFSAIEVADVSAANLAPFDTAVLNVASGEDYGDPKGGLECDISALNASQKADIVDFVAGGHKLIIYDSECTPAGGVDYSWLPFPFTTNNPGAQGAQGTVNIVEENTLSSSAPADPHYIDAVDLGQNTDAIGDMNVMVTLDSNWCLDMSGTNDNEVTGPVHTYARFGSVGSVGLIIYNGMDVDDMGYDDPDWLEKIWLQELQQPFNPDNLPCEAPVAGISLTPETATNDIGTSHTVTATVTDLLGDPVEGVEVTFEVTDGPNAAAVGTCSVNADCTTDANGQVSFTYTSGGATGTDTIEGCRVSEVVGVPSAAPQVQDQIVLEEACDTAAKDWVVPPTPTPTPTAAPTPAPTPAPTATPPVLAATPTPAPTPSPAVLEVAALPDLGGEPPDSGFPWLTAIAGAVAIIASGGLWLTLRARRVR